MICYFATNFLKNALKIDDSLDVFPVHGVGGMLGTLLAGVFCSTSWVSSAATAFPMASAASAAS